jgi:DNA-binding transcriptional ArsR family regulator
MSKSILFYWSKGAETRIKILSEIYKCNKKNKACYLNSLSEKLGLSHVAVKKHLDLVLEEKYIKEINPEGKPVYLKLTDKGMDVLKEFKIK